MPQQPANRSSADTARIVEVRGDRVMMDTDLAELFGVETRVLNQAVKRNRSRFPDAWAFQLTRAEFADLKSQSVMSSDEWGGRRTPPWVFSEHGVVMAASILRSERADTIMQHVVDVFVRARAGTLDKAALQPPKSKAAIAHRGGALSRRLQAMIDRLTSSIDKRQKTAVKKEATQVFQESLGHIKAKLSKAGLENEELAARAEKLLADAEADRAAARKTKAEADEIALRTMAAKLKLLLEAEQAIERGEFKGFLTVLDDLSRQ